MRTTKRQPTTSDVLRLSSLCLASKDKALVQRTLLWCIPPQLTSAWLDFPPRPIQWIRRRPAYQWPSQSDLLYTYLKQRAKSRCWWERGESQGQRVLFEGYYASLRIQEWFFLGIAGLEPATIRLKAQCSTNWAIHPILQEEKAWCGKEKRAAWPLFFLSYHKGAALYGARTAEQVWESFPLIEDSI